MHAERRVGANSETGTAGVDAGVMAMEKQRKDVSDE